ncbi:hypothetical protein [Parasitella parasitica]|uniref:EF-hand domain-containing protein n=1 Tax=Parasitella parasitica TaxID=35722 RepID=A0A0B7NC73_9FUNG|nr:hypothetical protein [Parasitella parasitica]
MKFILSTSIVLVYCALAVFARAGHGGGKGGRGSGGRGSGGGTSVRGSSGGRKGRSVAGTGSTPKSVSSKGGSGGFGIPPPTYYASTRANYPNYAPAYSGRYTSSSRYGYAGFYNPSLTYFWIVAPFWHHGYDSTYNRYQQDSGYYYAPQLTTQGSNSSNVVINGTVNSGDRDNYHYSFNVSTNNQYPMADLAFFSSSDSNALDADFAYRLQFSHLIEFDDANQNGFYDEFEFVYSLTSLQNLQWQPFQVQNITVTSNTSQYYLETSTTANVVYNNTVGGPNFIVRITYRTSNLQLNKTAPIVMQPNSLEYDFSIEGFPTAVANTYPNARLGVTQLVSSITTTPIIFDVNATTPLDIANQVKTNATYGLSIGDYTEGRSEYQSSVNISDVSLSSSIGVNATAVAVNVAYGPDDWIWGTITPSSRVKKFLLITLPGYTTGSNVAATMNTTFSGFGFLDTDVMNALANDGGLSLLGLTSAATFMNIILIAFTITIYFMTF